MPSSSGHSSRKSGKSSSAAVSFSHPLLSTATQAALDLLWDVLPQGLEGRFEVVRHEKTDANFRIWLAEVNKVPSPLPEAYHGKRVINTYTHETTVDDFPLRGRKGELILIRRAWKFEGVDKLYSADLPVAFAGTKVEREFANFLKELHRQFPDFREPGCLWKPSAV